MSADLTDEEVQEIASTASPNCYGDVDLTGTRYAVENIIDKRIAALQSENAHLRAELERVEVDAERYRKVRHYCSPGLMSEIFMLPELPSPQTGWSTEDWMDGIVDSIDAIDAARGKG